MSSPNGRHTWLNRAYVNLVYPLLDSQIHGGLAGRLRHYERLEGLTLEQNRELQWQALTRLLKHAYESSPFYHQRFDQAGLRPAEISSPQELKKIPPLTREEIREHLSEIWSRRFRFEDLRRAATGGTTDTPVPLLRDVGCLREKTAVQFRFNSWAGYSPGDKTWWLWGARIDYAENPSWRWRIYNRYLMRSVWAPTSLFNEAVLESYRQTINELRPRVIYAYPTPLALFCEYLRDSGRPYHRPATAICTAEPVLAHQRRLIQEVLDCPVFEHYGSRDFGMIAGECERHQGLHLNPAAAYVEYEPVAASSVEGLHEILVTDLLNYGMPMIRYRINDCAVPAPEACPCGRGYPLIQQIVGRTMDNFRLPNGDVVPGISLQNRVIQVCPGLKKIQVIQDTLEDFRVRFVPGETFSPADLRMLQGKLDEYFGKSVRWTFEKVDEIQRERSGKTRFCISRLASGIPSVPDSLQKPASHDL